MVNGTLLQRNIAAGGVGGALHLAKISTATLLRAVFAFNRGAQGGGGVAAQQTNVSAQARPLVCRPPQSCRVVCF